MPAFATWDGPATAALAEVEARRLRRGAQASPEQRRRGRHYLDDTVFPVTSAASSALRRSSSSTAVRAPPLRSPCLTPPRRKVANQGEQHRSSSSEASSQRHKNVGSEGTRQCVRRVLDLSGMTDDKDDESADEVTEDEVAMQGHERRDKTRGDREEADEEETEEASGAHESNNGKEDGKITRGSKGTERKQLNMCVPRELGGCSAWVTSAEDTETDPPPRVAGGAVASRARGHGLTTRVTESSSVEETCEGSVPLSTAHNLAQQVAELRSTVDEEVRCIRSGLATVSDAVRAVRPALDQEAEQREASEQRLTSLIQQGLRDLARCALEGIEEVKADVAGLKAERLASTEDGCRRRAMPRRMEASVTDGGQAGTTSLKGTVATDAATDCDMRSAADGAAVSNGPALLEEVACILSNCEQSCEQHCEQVEEALMEEIGHVTTILQDVLPAEVKRVETALNEEVSDLTRALSEAVMRRVPEECQQAQAAIRVEVETLARELRAALPPPRQASEPPKDSANHESDDGALMSDDLRAKKRNMITTFDADSSDNAQEQGERQGGLAEQVSELSDFVHELLAAGQRETNQRETHARMQVEENEQAQWQLRSEAVALQEEVGELSRVIHDRVVAEQQELQTQLQAELHIEAEVACGLQERLCTLSQTVNKHMPQQEALALAQLQLQQENEEVRANFRAEARAESQVVSALRDQVCELSTSVLERVFEHHRESQTHVQLQARALENVQLRTKAEIQTQSQLEARVAFELQEELCELGRFVHHELPAEWREAETQARTQELLLQESVWDLSQFVHHQLPAERSVMEVRARTQEQAFTRELERLKTKLQLDGEAISAIQEELRDVSSAVHVRLPTEQREAQAELRREIISLLERPRRPHTAASSPAPTSAAASYATPSGVARRLENELDDEVSKLADEMKWNSREREREARRTVVREATKSVERRCDDVLRRWSRDEPTRASSRTRPQDMSSEGRTRWSDHHVEQAS
eukprot:TRINITY_DN67668_c0_g1_i1.p1 TRINITY_DN67668_c0_g1~~TRINITY_DN67668_c0_g1_i1.p1  ORF type:complete len:1004 (+),score=198.19 TRINITY_DN67668_c0_g1_i1:24-3014(+)